VIIKVANVLVALKHKVFVVRVLKNIFMNKMDVERIQKINNLALDLMKQGLAVDRDDAISQAEKVYTGKDAEEYNSIRETLKEVKKDNTPEPEQKVIPTENLSQDEIKNILEKNTTFIVNKFRFFQEQISNMEKEIASLKTKMTYNRLPTAEQVSSNKEGITVQEAVNPPAPVSQKQGTNHRTGDYTDKDVSIEKFFYMGNK
jgi:hypothetical protein